MKKGSMIIMTLFLLVGMTASVYAKANMQVPPNGFPTAPINDQGKFILIPGNSLSSYYLDNSRMVKYVNSRLLDCWVKKVINEKEKKMTIKMIKEKGKLKNKIPDTPNDTPNDMPNEKPNEMSTAISNAMLNELLSGIAVGAPTGAPTGSKKKPKKRNLKADLDLVERTSYQLIHQQFDPVNFKYKTLEVYSYDATSQLLTITTNPKWVTIPVDSIEDRTLTCINDYLENSFAKVILR